MYTRIALLLAFASFLAAAEPVVVHEWGLIVNTGTSATLEGSPPAPITGDIWGMEDKAPVVYFHGAAVPGDFTVRIPDGIVTTCVPEPDMGGEGYSYATWSDLRLREPDDSVLDNILPGSEFEEYWRDVDALEIYRGSDGFSDRFIFYESTVGNASILPLTAQRGVPAVRMDYPDLEVLLLWMESATMKVTGVQALTDEHLLEQGWSDLDRDQVRSVLMGWSEGIINPDEFTAFWNTWGGWLLDDSHSTSQGAVIMVVYAVPPGILNRISQISFEPYVDLPVEYNRFLICAVPIGI
jgi:hypothetical protein